MSYGEIRNKFIKKICGVFMKLKLLIIITFLFNSTLTHCQENSNHWDKFNYLIGNWQGEGSGDPGKGEGYFSFKLDLDNKILIRNSHSEYPAVKDKPLIIHDDLMIVYLNYSGKPERAIYFDNEGHVINYSITFSDSNDIVFTSDIVPKFPIFKLTYSKIENDLLNTKFEISQDGKNYITYVEGKSKRQK